jgi:predicted transcriptional regulator of viral defense system
MRRQTEILHKTAALAARQYGIVTRDQLIELGYTERTLDLALEKGRLQAWHRDIFAVGHGGLSPHGLCMAAVLFRGDDALISHQSAAWLWGLEGKLEIPVNVSLRRRGRPRGAIGLHHSPDLRDEDAVTIEGLPVTSVPRTLLDYAATAPRYRLEFALERADRLDLLDPEAVDEILEEADGHPGRQVLDQALNFYPAANREAA